MFAFASYFSIGAVLHMLVNIKRQTFIDVDRDFGTIIGATSTMYFILRFLLNLEDVILLYKQLSDFKTFGAPINFTQRNRTLNKFSTFFCFYQIGIVLSVNITSSVLSLEACKTDDGLRVSLKEACGLITPTWLPFDFHQTPLKYLVYLYEMYATLYIYHTSGFMSYVIMESTEHVIMRFEHVRGSLIEALSIHDKHERRLAFSKAVRYHNAVIQFRTFR